MKKPAGRRRSQLACHAPLDSRCTASHRSNRRVGVLCEFREHLAHHVGRRQVGHHRDVDVITDAAQTHRKGGSLQGTDVRLDVVLPNQQSPSHAADIVEDDAACAGSHDELSDP